VSVFQTYKYPFPSIFLFTPLGGSSTISMENKLWFCENSVYYGLLPFSDHQLDVLLSSINKIGSKLDETGKISVKFRLLNGSFGCEEYKRGASIIGSRRKWKKRKVVYNFS